MCFVNFVDHASAVRAGEHLSKAPRKKYSEGDATFLVCALTSLKANMLRGSVFLALSRDVLALMALAHDRNGSY